MKNIIIALVLAVLLGAGYLGYKYVTSCTEPDGMLVQITALNCMLDMVKNPDALRANVCVALGRSSDCELDPVVDRDVGVAAIRGLEAKCVKKELQDKNICIDKVDEFLK